MTNEARWRQYLFENHSQAEIGLWARQLQFFRFCRAYGGHANDGDELKVALEITSEEDLIDTCKSLGLSLRHIPADSPKPVPGVQYSWQEITKFVSFVHDFPTIEQPGWTTLFGSKVFVCALPGRIEIHVMDEHNPYVVSAAAVDVASKIEELLRPLAERLIEPPQDNRNCICPKFYPEFWRE